MLRFITNKCFLLKLGETLNKSLRSIRFEFGDNWTKYSRLINERIIRDATSSLRSLMSPVRVEGKSFLDVGCGSGIHSLAAHRLNAKEIAAFDYDSHSVQTTKKVFENFVSTDINLKIQQGDILDKSFISTLGTFDIVYSWGVLHHTGDMWVAISNSAEFVNQEGVFVVAIYNDQGIKSDLWGYAKKVFCRSPRYVQVVMLIVGLCRFWLPTAMKDLFKGTPNKTWDDYSKQRGMSPIYDLRDWMGGYPFEVAKPAEVITLMEENGFFLLKGPKISKGHGCNEFVFQRIPETKK